MGGNCNKQQRRQPSNVQQMQQVPQYQYGQYPAYGQYMAQAPQPQQMAMPPQQAMQQQAQMPMAQPPPQTVMQQPVTVLPPIPINYTGGMGNFYRPAPPMMPCAQAGGQGNDRRQMVGMEQEQQDYASRYYAEQMPSGKSRKH